MGPSASQGPSRGAQVEASVGEAMQSGEPAGSRPQVEIGQRKAGHAYSAHKVNLTSACAGSSAAGELLLKSRGLVSVLWSILTHESAAAGFTAPRQLGEAPIFLC